MKRIWGSRNWVFKTYIAISLFLVDGSNEVLIEMRVIIKDILIDRVWCRNHPLGSIEGWGDGDVVTVGWKGGVREGEKYEKGEHRMIKNLLMIRIECCWIRKYSRVII